MRSQGIKDDMVVVAVMTTHKWRYWDYVEADDGPDAEVFECFKCEQHIGVPGVIVEVCGTATNSEEVSSGDDQSTTF